MWGPDRDTRHELFGGDKAVHVWNWGRDGLVPPFAAVLACELDPGGSVGAHRQEHCPEIVIGLEGTGEVTVDGTSRPLGPGTVINLALGSVLTIANASTEAPLRYLIVKAFAEESGA